MFLKRIAAYTVSTLLLSPFFAPDVQAQSLNAKCLLQIDGVNYMNDLCYFEMHENDDFFSDLRIVISCPNGRPIEQSGCPGVEQRVTQPGVFGYLIRTSQGSASVCWNENNGTRADTCFGNLNREGACWLNNRSIHENGSNRVSNVKFCAWAR